MIINKFTTEEDLKKLNDGDEIKITKDVALNFHMLDFLLSNFPKSQISILSGYDKTQVYSAHGLLYTEEETLVLAENINHARTTYGKDILFDGMYTAEQAISASKKINDVVAEIKRHKLSPFEQFVYAYNFVTNRIYNEENEDESIDKSRNLIEVLNGDKIVCVGFANLLCEILTRLNIPCTTQTEIGYDFANKEYTNHLVCLVRMEDPKYKIKGIYQSDPTTDAAKTQDKIYGENSFNFALNQINYIEDIHDETFVLNRGLENDDAELHSFNDVEKASTEVPVNMSALFPEKTQGKNQIQIIKEEVNKKIEKAKIKDKIKNFIESLTEEKLEEFASNFKGKTPNFLVSTAETTNYILNAISDHVVLKEFFNADFIDEGFSLQIKNLLKSGLNFEEIKNILIFELNNFDATNSYLKNDEKLLKYSQINEHEVYAKHPSDIDYDFFYNTPYESEFYSLCDNATFVSEFNFYRACQKIFLAEGFDFSEAGDFASQMLRKTKIFDPKIFH